MVLDLVKLVRLEIKRELLGSSLLHKFPMLGTIFVIELRECEKERERESL